MSELVKELQEVCQAMRAKGNLEESEIVYRAAMEIEKARRTYEYWKAEHLAGNAEIETLREKARLYDEALGQESVGMFWHNGAGRWVMDAPDKRIKGITVPLYAKPLPQAMAVPDGWQLVPVEPTPEMKTAAIAVDIYQDGARHGECLTWEEADAIYRAMLSAAPEYKP